ncbi:MAG: phenylacetate--CoA ligase family protein [Anaerolineae bacterium]|nr:phenylacetate--CoA ligase family protein [Anaerolineae bacterium]
MRRLVRHAYDKVPYYRRLFDSVAVKPEDITEVEDLARLPVTSKEDLVGLRQEEILAQVIDHDRCRKAMTSGSTGVPLTIVHRRQDLTKMNLGWLRAYLAHGVKPWHRMTAFIGERDIPKHRPWYEYLGFMRRKVLSTWDDPGQWISELRTWRPQALTGYVMTLKLLAAAMQKQGVTDIGPRVVFQTSGLLDQASRQFLHSALRAKIVDIYGSSEAGCIAWECGTCSSYHVGSDMLIVEVLDNAKPAPPGKEGEVVITNLHSYAMPFIRYRQGDVARWDEASPRCGRGFPLIKIIEGRLGDFITLPSGKKLSPHHFFIALDTAAGVARWRLVQETARRLTAEVVVDPDSSVGALHAAQANLKAIVGEDMEVIVTPVPSLPYDPAHKFRSVMSMVREQ